MSTLTEYPRGWTCRTTAARLERYLSGALPRPELLAIAEHVEACALCAEDLALLRFAHIEIRVERRAD